jgi:hypothetical protein
MKRFEDEMTAFARPNFFTSERPINLDARQLCIFAVWVSPITVLAEYIDRSKIASLSPKEIAFSSNLNLRRPQLGSLSHVLLILIYGLQNTDTIRRLPGSSLVSLSITPLSCKVRPNNTQISSFGMDKLFVQTFSCPNQNIVADFWVEAKTQGMAPIWPIPTGFWPFSKRSAKFPTQLVLDNKSADITADAFNERMKIMTQPPYFGGRVR